MKDYLFFVIAGALIFVLAVIYNVYKKTKENKFTLPAMITRRIKIDKTFTTKEKQAILSALTVWKKVTCGLFDYIVVDDKLDDLFSTQINTNTIVFLRGTENDTLIKQIDYTEQAKIFGYAYHSVPNVIILIPERLDTFYDLKFVAVHEIGHILRINHINDKESVMSKYYTGFNKITRNDLIAFLSCCRWDYEHVRYDDDPFWYHENENFNANRLKRFYDCNK